MNPLERLFPIVNDWVLAKMDAERGRSLAAAGGDVLEIGFGTGLNLRHYRGVKSVTAVEPSEGMSRKGQSRAAQAPFPVRIERGFAEKLPFADESFDTVVSTFVLCSVRDVGKALGEMGRVLRQGGKLILLEHVRSEDPAVAKWQDRVDPVWTRALGGCHANRDLTGLPERHAGLTAERIERFIAPQPKLAAPHIRGTWVKP